MVQGRLPRCLGLTFLSFLGLSSAFMPINKQTNVKREGAFRIFSSATDAVAPQVIATGYSSDENLGEALRVATVRAIEALPEPLETGSKIDLAVISVSSLYDGAFSPALAIPSVLDAASGYGAGVQHLIGSTVGGIVSSTCNLESYDNPTVCTPVEVEGALGVSVALFLLPDVNVKTFHVMASDIPDDYARFPPNEWKQSVGLANINAANKEAEKAEDPVFMLIPSPAFQNDLEDLLQGLQFHYPDSTTFGAIASTVSSLSRAKLFIYDSNDGMEILGDGCVGVALEGDIAARTMLAQGTKPVGGIYQILKATGSTINAIVLDETATELEQQALEAEDDETQQQDIDDDEDDESGMDANAQAKAAYAKANIPKPALAEANFLMKTLSDDDQMFMKKTILIGLEVGGSMGRSPSELKRLREGGGHRFEVFQVASAGMKDGSVTLPLGSVDIKPGTRMRFFVRESDFAKKEVDALWMGYKKRVLSEGFKESAEKFNPTGCFMTPTLDRGNKFFLGKPGFESTAVTQYIPSIPAVAGFFSNGVIMKLDQEDKSEICASTHGSSSGYVLFGSKSARPIYSPAQAAASKRQAADEQAKKEAEENAAAEEDEKRQMRTKSPVELQEKAPRSDDGELILKRREVHSGRAISVSTVEWSVAEKTATPTSTLEGYMWDKETEVDRFRERVPLANLVSQCRLSVADPEKPKPRDWIGPVKEAVSKGEFVIIPDCKRMEPVTGSLRKRYELQKLVRKFTQAGAPSLSVNCDGILFGGSLDDITVARTASSTAAIEMGSEDGTVPPPVMASDLLLYPYQLYKLRLAGADAVNLVAGALASKDLLYLTKIASSLQLQTLITVTSDVQLQAIATLSPGSFQGVIVSNRELEDFTFDMSGEQALRLLESEALKTVREQHGKDITVLVEGRVGIIERADSEGSMGTSVYLDELREAGASGAIMGGGLAVDDSDYSQILESMRQTA